MRVRLFFPLVFVATANFVSAQPFNLVLNDPPVDRWMYAFNFTPADRPSASAFGTFGDAAGVDTRHAEYLIGFDTFSLIATNRGATNYLVRRVRLTLTVNRDLAFRYDPTHDTFTTYFPTNDPGYQPDADADRPIELFGAGFRNGFTDASFVQDSAFGSNAPGQRNAFAVGYSTNGALVDVANNVGKTNAAFPPFEVYPFAVGQTTNVNPGDLVPVDSQFTFDLNLADPLVRQYVQEALNRGRLRLIISCLDDTSGQGSSTGFPDFLTHFSLFGDGPILELEATAIRPDDSDNDGLPDDWEQFYFNSLNQNAGDDPDGDGQSNHTEYLAGTKPNAADEKLRILSAHREANGVFVLQFSFAASRQYVVEFSRDLKSWSPVTNPALIYYNAPGAAEWRDDGSRTGGLDVQRFYRIRLP